MKFLLIILISNLIISCKAQSPVYTKGSPNIPNNIPDNAYIKDADNILNKFVGIWKYENNGKIFTINLQKLMVKFANYYVDELNGYYKYTDGMLTVVDTSNYPVNESQLNGRWINNNNLNKITLFFSDSERPRLSCEVDLTYSNQGGIEKLHWELKIKGIHQQKPAPGINLNPATDVRVPTNVDLIKQ